MIKDNTERRKYKRFTYKADCCSILDCQTIRYKVLNISEGGLKIEVQSQPERQSDTTWGFAGTLRFSNGKQLQVSGKLVWIIGNQIGIKLNEPINEKMLKDEMDNFEVDA